MYWKINEWGMYVIFDSGKYNIWIFIMEELNELKNLVIQTLEANGQLSNIRAQIRSSVFKIVD